MKKILVGSCVALLLASVMCVTGCSKEGKTEAVTEKVVYWTMWNEAEPQGMVISEAVEAFTEETGIEVDVNYNGREIRKTLQPALDAGENIDVFDEDIERVLNAWGDYLLPLDKYVAQSYSTTDGEAYSDVVNQKLIKLAKRLGGNSVRNIPYQPMAFVTMYNRDLFEKAGIKKAPKNWDEMLDACAKLKAIGVYGVTVDDVYMAALFGYCMDRLVGAEATYAMVKNNDFSGPQVLEFGKIWEEMAKKGYVSPKAASNIFPAGQVDEIASGKAAMYLNGTWLANEIKGNAPGMKWGQFAWPAMSENGDGVDANNYGAQSFGINKNSKNPSAAFKLVVWLTTGKWDEVLAAQSLGIPVGKTTKWPVALEQAESIVNNTTKRLNWAVGMEDNPNVNAKIKENFAKLIKGDLTAETFAKAMAK